MPHVGLRVDADTYLRIEHYCKNHKLSKTQFVKDALQEKLIGDMFAQESDWKTNAATFLGITIGQLSYAIANSTTVGEAFARLNDKSDVVSFYPIQTPDEIGIEVTRGIKTFVVKAYKSGSKLETIVNLLKMIEEKIFEDATLGAECDEQ